MHLLIKRLFQFDETYVLIAWVAKLIFNYCYSVNFGPSWLLHVDSPLQLVVRSIRTLLKQITGLKIFFKTLKGLHESPFKQEPLYPDISCGAFEIKTYFSLVLKKVGSYMRGYTVH